MMKKGTDQWYYCLQNAHLKSHPGLLCRSINTDAAGKSHGSLAEHMDLEGIVKDRTQVSDADILNRRVFAISAAEIRVESLELRGCQFAQQSRKGQYTHI